MQERIYTIPVNDVFEPKEGCPLCRLRDLLEERCLEYIMGAAMMEPDIRVETNRLGFCKDHLEAMRERKNRLSLALMLQTHLEEVHEKNFGKKKLLGKKSEKKEPTCYVCQKIDSVIDTMVGNILKMYASDPEFRTLFETQEVICLPHYELLSAQTGKLPKKLRAPYQETLDRLTGEYLAALKEDVRFFTTRFDYRFGGKDADWGTSKDSIERAIWFLTSRK